MDQRANTKGFHAWKVTKREAQSPPPPLINVKYTDISPINKKRKPRHGWMTGLRVCFRTILEEEIAVVYDTSLLIELLDEEAGGL